MEHQSHKYLFQEDGISYTSPSGRHHILPWTQLKGISTGLFHQKKLYLKSKGKCIPLNLSSDQLKKFIPDFFEKWKAIDFYAAKKAAFDYIDDNKSFYRIFLFLSIFVCLTLAYVMIHEATSQYQCTKALKANAISVDANITKMKKKRAGQWDIHLEFNSSMGTIKGKDLLLDTGEKDPEKTIPILVSQSNPACWTLANKSLSSENSIWAKRRFFTAYVFLFGCFFLIFGLFGATLSVLRLNNQRPLSKEIIQLFDFKIQ